MIETLRPKFLMFASSRQSEPYSVERFEALKRAIDMAQGDTEILSNDFGYAYTRDGFILVGDRAFYSNHSRFNHPLLGDRAALYPVLEQLGYRFHELNALPDEEIEGGNFIDLPGKGLLFHGYFNLLGDMSLLNPDLFRAGREIGDVAGRIPVPIEITTRHLDCVLGILPNGTLLVKLDETGYRQEVIARTGLRALHLPLAGVTERGMRTLHRYADYLDILTFSVLRHPDADVVLGIESFTDEVRARSWVDLPARAIKYVRRIEELIRCPVALVSTSPEREDTILVRDPFAG